MAAAAASPANNNCRARIELQLLTDRTASWKPIIANANLITAKVANYLNTYFPGSRMSWALYADKPIPYSGYGPYGDMKYNIVHDKCYTMQTPMSSIGTTLPLIDNIQVSGGFDLPENTLNASINAILDPRVGWTRTYSEADPTNPTGTVTPVRVQLIMTDYIPHVGPDSGNWAKDLSMAYNVGRFNDAFFATPQPSGKVTSAWATGSCVVGGAVWNAGKLLHDKTSRTPAEQAQLQQYYAKCGPYVYPAPKPYDAAALWNDLNDSSKNIEDTFTKECKENEYATPSDWATAAKTLPNFAPTFVVSNENYSAASTEYIRSKGFCPNKNSPAGECLQNFYNNLIHTAGYDDSINAAVLLKDKTNEDIVNIILEAVHTAASQYCPVPVTTTTTTTKPTTTSTTTTTPPTTTTTTTTSTTTTTTSTTTTTTPTTTTPPTTTTRLPTTPSTLPPTVPPTLPPTVPPTLPPTLPPTRPPTRPPTTLSPTKPSTDDCHCHHDCHENNDCHPCCAQPGYMLIQANVPIKDVMEFLYEDDISP